ncbi:alpha-L-fucosidase [Streptomyces sp. KL116D]|uniref:alpha-L-fucosidase n=1 Tax=Streptomyces sp. KL116D TaxID=3045152 RepID=UPI0035580B1E
MSIDELREPTDATGARYTPDWASLRRHHVPDWFRDAKLGIWAHWGPQSAARRGDWYARHLYGPYAGTEDFERDRTARQTAHHRARHGHPSRFGHKDLCHTWRAERFDPDALMDRFRRAGARYFVSLAAHCDNFDLWDSTRQPWNAVNVGPRTDVVARWEAAARAAGLRFGISMHAGSWTWRWLDAAFGRDSDGPYDGHLTAADGHGTWWEGLDPRALYGPPRRPGDTPTTAFVEDFYARLTEVTERYGAELVYLDDSRLPFDDGSVCEAAPADRARGLDFLAAYYNRTPEGAVSIKTVAGADRGAVLLDVERHQFGGLDPHPWQYDTSIGDWFHSDGETYKSAQEIVHLLVDTVSKNGCLLLNVPQLPDGTLDDEVSHVLDSLGAWLRTCGEAIYGTRPWTVYGEGPTNVSGERSREARLDYTAQDLRFTRAAEPGVVYAFVMSWPDDRKVRIRSLDTTPATVTLLGSPEPVTWRGGPDGLEVRLPDRPPTPYVQVLRLASA